ncbi:glycosyltransferase N-terminal domain-containing protein [Planktotalea sp.]|uniref:3-deoxy-D-manno-octulosonic acid transferase n=1 Tax=Planktotalea sp. TaxID=2029877 RepID=UPI0025E39D0A|nr:glycosyltransferase N-terminal domain-containing protein [Planktotalea sp.]
MSSLSLTAYKALAKSMTIPQSDPYPERPAGPLIWGVVHDEASARALVYLVERLRQMRGPCSLLITYVGKMPRLTSKKGVFCHSLPVDTTETSKWFLEHWRPALCLWFGGELRPALIAEAKAFEIPMSLLSAQADLLDQSIWRWLPSLARETLGAFLSLSARDANGYKALRKMGGARRKVSMQDLLQDAVLPPTVNESVFESVSTDLNGRPVWLAAHIQEDELKAVLRAHRATSKLTHRLALVLVAASFPVSVEARALLKSQGWRVCHWEDGDLIEENTQVILVEEPEEMGLWYRIAPFCFLGSSLKPLHGGCDPYVPATLGSAIIYGPNVGRHTSSYSRLASVGGARIVNDADSLAQAIEQLLAADQSALMAHAAWATISEGAEATDSVIDDIHDHLDALESAS